MEEIHDGKKLFPVTDYAIPSKSDSSNLCAFWSLRFIKVGESLENESSYRTTEMQILRAVSARFSIISVTNMKLLLCPFLIQSTLRPEYNIEYILFFINLHLTSSSSHHNSFSFLPMIRYIPCKLQWGINITVFLSLESDRWRQNLQLKRIYGRGKRMANEFIAETSTGPQHAVSRKPQWKAYHKPQLKERIHCRQLRL